MASGASPPVPGTEVTPLTPKPGEGDAAGGVQPELGPDGQPITPVGSEAQPGLGDPGTPVAQPGEGVTEPVVPAVPPAEPGQTAEERIQGLVTEVSTLKGQLAAMEDIQDLAEELEETLDSLRGVVVQPEPAIPPATTPPAAQPPATGVEGQIATLTQQVQTLANVVQKVANAPDEAKAYHDYVGLEDQLIKNSGITNEGEVSRLKSMIETEMDKGKFDWTNRRVARRVVRGQINEFQQLKRDLVTSSVQPAAPGTPVVQPAVVQPGEPPPVTPAPEVEGESPLDQAAKELGPVLEQVFRTKGGGVI